MSELIVAGGNAPPVLEAAESAFNDIPGPLSEFVKRMFALTGWIVGDDRLAASVAQPSAQGIAIVGGIGQTASRSQLGHYGRPARGIATMARADNPPPGAPGLVNRRMGFGGPSPTRPADRLLVRPPFPPAADRCALTGGESSSSATGGPPALDSRANIPSQTPLRAQRTNRLYHVLGGP